MWTGYKVTWPIKTPSRGWFSSIQMAHALITSCFFDVSLRFVVAFSWLSVMLLNSHESWWSWIMMVKVPWIILVKPMLFNPFRDGSTATPSLYRTPSRPQNLQQRDAETCPTSGTRVSQNQWEFQDPKMEVPYHIRPYFAGISPYIALI